MHRFMVEPGQIENNRVIISGDDLRHLRQVLRLKAGDIISVFDGSGMEYEVRLSAVEKEMASGDVLSSGISDTEPRTRLTLFQGLPKAEKMDWIVQKAVELGVYRIVPVITERTVVKLSEADKEKKRERWSRIAREASKQCRRARVPEVALPIVFSDIPSLIKQYDLFIMLYENQKKCLKEHMKCYNINKIGSIALFIGPEGGFADSEAGSLEPLNIVISSLGKRILRTETAALTGISLIMYEMGEMQS